MRLFVYSMRDFDEKPFFDTFCKKYGVEYEMCIRDRQYSMQLMRKAGKYCINLYENDYSALWEMGMITPLFDGFAVLEQSTYYDENCGIQLNTEMGIGHYY